MIKNCDFRSVFIFTWGVMGVKIRTERDMQSVVSGRKGEKQDIKSRTHKGHLLTPSYLSHNAISVVIVI